MTTPTREELTRLSARPLSAARNRTKAEVVLVSWRGADIVVKDFRVRGFFVRETIGRFSIARECRAYRRLAGLPGVPAFIGRIDAHAFAAAFVPGTALPSHSKRSLPPTLFTALAALLSAIHDRGIAIADLHHRNIIVGEGAGSCSIIDFSLALVRPASWNLPGRWIWARAANLDTLALERIRLRYQTGAAVDADAVPSSRLYAWGRSLKSLSARIRRKHS
jgi:hypothetical protein